MTLLSLSHLSSPWRGRKCEKTTATMQLQRSTNSNPIYAKNSVRRCVLIPPSSALGYRKSIACYPSPPIPHQHLLHSSPRPDLSRPPKLDRERVAVETQWKVCLACDRSDWRGTEGKIRRGWRLGERGKLRLSWRKFDRAR